MDIIRITAQWTGFPGAPGYSNFHFSTDGGFWDGGLIGDSAEVAAEGAAGRIIDAFTACRSLLPDNASVEVQPEVLVMDSDSGEILTSIDIDGGSVTSSAASNASVGPAGAVVNWRTNDYRFGRRIRGRTFLVPLNVTAYEEDGTLSTLGRSNARNFADEMINGDGPAEFGVWSRPRDGAGGVFATVTSSSVPDMAAVLRSRRD